MNEYPILYSTEMVKSIISGTKTQTRRVFKDHPRLSSDLSKVDLNKWMGDHPDYILSFCPYGKPGDILWVRETYKSIGFDDDIMPQLQIQYKDGVIRWVDVDVNVKLIAQNKWKPSIHMPKAAARIWLQITSISVQRIQDISAFDAWNEGIEAFSEDYHSEPGAVHGDYKNYLWRDDPKYCDYFFPSYADPTMSFKSLWIKINGKNSWDKNPWVWVVEFEVLSTTGKNNVGDYILSQLSRKEDKS